MQCIIVVHLVGVIKGCLMVALLSKHLHTVPSALKMEAQVLRNVGTSLVENYTVTFQKAVCLTFPSVRTSCFT
jgi:NADH:ubiquinone oxidoreductase subunit 6 (subunit J)